MNAPVSVNAASNALVQSIDRRPPVSTVPDEAEDVLLVVFSGI